MNIIDINQRKVEYLMVGKGTNVVVIVPGMGCSIYSWLNVVDEIKKDAKVIVFHRSGLGNTDLHPKGNSTETACEDLNNLMKVLQISEKVILVGHSYGGICVQHFARLYPNKVKALVLVDSSSMDAYKFNELDIPVADETQSDEAYVKEWTRQSKLTKEQLNEEIKPSLSSEELSFPIEVQKRILDFMISPNLYKSAIDETIDLRYGVKNIRDVGEFPDIPLKVLVRDYEYSLKETIDEDGIPKKEAEKLENLWRELSYDLAKLSNQSEIKFVKDSGHAIHNDQRQIVINTIKELLI